ncbi:MAG: ABC transporter permease subunit [Armatimonadia bacterium]|nr:ABC transporter permease subunit [Armatimonadia bacterium]
MTMAALRSELSKLYRQRITWVSFVIVLALVGLITWGSHHERDRLDVSDEFGSQFVVAGKTVTALFVANAVMQVALTVLVPLLIAVVVGALVAGERQSGTLRMLLSRPVARWKVLLAKLATSAAFTVSLTLLLGLAGLGLGQIVFGWGDLVVLRGGLTIFEPQMGLVRLAQAYGLACVAMCSVAALALMLSTIFNNPMTAAGLTVAFLLVSQIVGVMPHFDSIQPHLLTTHLDIHREVLAADVDRAALLTSAQYLAGYIAAASTIALVVFDRRDVTC